jgi:hypothetical protein
MFTTNKGEIMSHTDLTPEFIAESRDGIRLEIEKMGGGTLGQAYQGTWCYRVTWPASGGREGNVIEGQDLDTPMPATHENAASVLCGFLDLDWQDFTHVTGRYVVQFYDGLPGGGLLPEPPHRNNTCNTLRQAVDMFREWMRQSGNDYKRADGYGEPSATVHAFDAWDGISYGDYPLAMFTRGIRGGIVRECV